MLTITPVPFAEPSTPSSGSVAYSDLPDFDLAARLAEFDEDGFITSGSGSEGEDDEDEDEGDWEQLGLHPRQQQRQQGSEAAGRGSSGRDRSRSRSASPRPAPSPGASPLRADDDDDDRSTSHRGAGSSGCSASPAAAAGRRAIRSGAVEWYQQRLSCPVAHDGTTLLQLLYGVLVMQVRDRLPVASVRSFLRMMQRMSTAPKLVPTCPKTMQRVLGVPDWQTLERHFCDAEGCSGFIWEKISRSEWQAAHEDPERNKCPACSAPRFRTIARGGREVLEPCAWFIDFGVEAVLRSFFTDPQFVEAWRQGRVKLVSPDQESGSWAAGGLNEQGNCTVVQFDVHSE